MKHFITTTLVIGVLSALLTGCGQDSNAKTTDTAKPAQTEKSPLQNHPAQSSDPNHQADIAQALQDNLNKSGVDVHVTSVVPTDVPEMYWVTLDKAQPVFVDKTGQYLFQGDIVQVGGNTPINIGAKMQSMGARTTLAGIDKAEMIVFPAKGESKSHIYVFTDPTCHYCQKLHGEIDKLNAGGIEVRYLAWPRGKQMQPLAESVWCSKDRNDALTRAKNGERITAPTCDNPVEKHMAIGHSLGVSGTPAIFAPNGMQLGGYVPADELVKMAIENQ